MACPDGTKQAATIAFTTLAPRNRRNAIRPRTGIRVAETGWRSGETEGDQTMARLAPSNADDIIAPVPAATATSTPV